jgi:hypothetical protein
VVPEVVLPPTLLPALPVVELATPVVELVDVAPPEPTVLVLDEPPTEPVVVALPALQTPPTQLCPAPHAFPQLPQLAAFWSSVWHPAPQSVWPAGQPEGPPPELEPCTRAPSELQLDDETNRPRSASVIRFARKWFEIMGGLAEERFEAPRCRQGHWLAGLVEKLRRCDRLQSSV